MKKELLRSLAELKSLRSDLHNDSAMRKLDEIINDLEVAVKGSSQHIAAKKALLRYGALLIELAPELSSLIGKLIGLVR